MPADFSKGEAMRRLLAIPLVLAVVMLAAPAAGAPADFPVVGSWESTDVDGSHQHMTIGNGPNRPFFLRDDGGTVCDDAGFGFVPITVAGNMQIFNEDPLQFFFGPADVYCYPRGAGGRQLVFTGAFFGFQYEPVTDTIFDFAGVCWYRSGNPDSCSGG